MTDTAAIDIATIPLDHPGLTRLAEAAGFQATDHGTYTRRPAEYDPNNPDDCPRGIRGHIDNGDGYCHLCDRDLIEAE